MLLTWLQASLLFFIQALIAPETNEAWNASFWKERAWIFPAITAYSMVVSAALSLAIMACSSLSKNKRHAGTAFAIFIIGTCIMGGMLAEALHNDNWTAISPFFSAVDLGYYLFHLDGNRDLIAAWAAWAGILATCALSLFLIHKRVSSSASQGR